MPRRVSLPGADELFRTTGGTSLTPAPRAPDSLQNREAREAREAREGRESRDGREGRPADPAGEHGAAAAVEPAEPAAQAAGQYNGAPHNGTPRTNAQQLPGPRPAGPQPPAGADPARRKPRGAGRSRPTGRERHEEKITVYVSAEELIDLEHARLVLRGEHGLAVDRGRIVREAVAVVLADLEQRGEASILVRRLRGR
ncbi:hypothetical protein [Streptacidiphilus sp. PB12-B1b]|uniref:hypothetical protein n=1 Tax=Streptacidiphilus sp. PB12-B1b TaxID=2705012 RepID=UPI001CDCFCCB|nr:hypothetical protein [Streptacidiphilus sp. PB12-B1b]